MPDDDRFQKALLRNLSELQRAIYYRRAWSALKSTDRLTSGLDVFELMDRAFFDQMVGHAIKVFDRNRQSASFWHLLRQRRTEIEEFCETRSCKLDCIEMLTAKLKIVRNKTHFHIDGDCVSDPKVSGTLPG
jgi:hypothetical protein